MNKIHDDQLTHRLEKILTSGSTFISWNELYLWCGVQKLAAKTYRDLSQRWEEVSLNRSMPDDSPLGPLSYVQSPMGGGGGIFLFGENMPRLIVSAP